MTLGTGKRSYRACLRCRQRKTRCDLDKIGEPKKAPCASCHESGSECILTKSRRGGNFRHHRPGSASKTATPGREDQRSRAETAVYSPAPASESTNESWSDDRDSDGGEDSGNVLNMELRNPSDALHILALSGEKKSTSGSRGESTRGERHGSSIDYAHQGHEGTNVMQAGETQEQQPWKSATTIFDDYELVQRGLLRPSLVFELLLRYSRFYHPFCPIVPSYILQPRNTPNIQRSDYFLLTAIITIASRDDPRHSLTHRYCWDHAQRLLVDVLLAQPWTQTSRTVEGLLLLAEWLPHIQVQETASEATKNLFSEDRTAWSLVGLAVRHGYLQRLDQGAFRNSNSNISKERAEQNRLVWAHIWMADRQISVRLGQSFWSRGPSHTSNFTANDFPSLQPCPETDNEDYASLLQATMEVVQIMHNAHAVLYSSKERTLAMVYDSHYARYLDDFKTAISMWHATWSNLNLSHKMKSTLMIMYEYICLYTNAFSFQAVLTRASASSDKSATKRPFSEVFSNGIMLSPDGRFVFDALNAATNLLSLISGLDPQNVVCYLPSRYYLYGVYAAVLLHKADCAGAFHSGNQRQEVTSLARAFITTLEKAPSTESHVCHSYSRILRQLWSRRDRRHSKTGRSQNETPARNPRAVSNFSTQAQQPSQEQQNHNNNSRHNITHQDSLTNPVSEVSPAATSLSGNANTDHDVFGMPPPFDNLGMDSDMPAFPSVEGYFLGSFMPGVADFGSPSFGDGLGSHDALTAFQDWGFGGGGGAS
ncbi:hypothetical protein BDV06DRAFT_200122 [Aspergillus oleicola]